MPEQIEEAAGPCRLETSKLSGFGWLQGLRATGRVGETDVWEASGAGEMLDRRYKVATPATQ